MQKPTAFLHTVSFCTDAGERAVQSHILQNVKAHGLQSYGKARHATHSCNLSCITPRASPYHIIALHTSPCMQYLVCNPLCAMYRVHRRMHHPACNIPYVHRLTCNVPHATYPACNTGVYRLSHATSYVQYPPCKADCRKCLSLAAVRCVWGLTHDTGTLHTLDQESLTEEIQHDQGRNNDQSAGVVDCGIIQALSCIVGLQ